MSRYVDIDRLEPQQFENSEVELGVLAYDYEVVQSEPYIDIVRCGECKYYEAKEDWCYWRDESITANDFCSYGCRDSEKPNNCEYAENPSGDVWECGCFLDTYCEHQIYDRNPDGTINIVECGYEPKDKSQTDCKTCKYGQDKHRYAHICNECGVGINNYTPQTERSSK